VWNKGINLTQFVRESLDEAREEMLLLVNDADNTRKELKILLIIIKELNQAINELKTNLINILPIEIAIFNIVGLEGEKGGNMIKINDEKRSQFVKSSKLENSIDKKGEEEEIVKINKKKEVNKDNNKLSFDNKDEKNKSKVENIPLKKQDLTNLDPSEQLKLIISNWNLILSKAKGYNHFLTAILSGSKVILKEDQILFVVKTSFHRQRLESNETKRILIKIIYEICGINIDFKCIIDTTNKSTNKNEETNEKLVEELFN
jgi:hypothetical protein